MLLWSVIQEPKLMCSWAQYDVGVDYLLISSIGLKIKAKNMKTCVFDFELN